MCGIVAAITNRNVSSILIEGLKRLEYRGYDSAGIALLDDNNKLIRVRTKGKVEVLEQELKKQPLSGKIGIAHTRWATHGKPTTINAHPHFSSDRVAIVHNGIIENYKDLQQELKEHGYICTSQTDTEIVAHMLDFFLKQGSDLKQAVQKSVKKIKGAYAIVAMEQNNPHQLIAFKKASPLVIGVGIDENFIASDAPALSIVTNRFIYPADENIIVLDDKSVQIYDKNDKLIKSKIVDYTFDSDPIGKGGFSHYMEKEIFEQPATSEQTLEGRISHDKTTIDISNKIPDEILKQVECCHIVACGTSYHAGMVAKYWLEQYAKIPTSIEVASEYRYRSNIVPKNTLYITISQSGETADSIAALKKAQNESNYLSTLVVCNVEQSTMVREAKYNLITRAGVEVGVASTKAFTTQLLTLSILTASLAKLNNDFNEKEFVESLVQLPLKIQQVLEQKEQINKLSTNFKHTNSMLFLGRLTGYPIALEGALKLKEISYIHAESYPAGELKHGPLALIDESLPTIAVVMFEKNTDKLLSNLEEVKSRGGDVYIFADERLKLTEDTQTKIINIPAIDNMLAPILHIIPLQLLAYYVAVHRGTDIDQPRNLAKSVTVE
ncbi:MAG: glutamine--fructose-6-phosphate transaminase (isomerizing) [Gammaproteobacteria bacterium]|nr:MAG: glutamine--fructose-6-phosphate transaminase (isomerizing) [Gammaproteobacteria bacterium]